MNRYTQTDRAQNDRTAAVFLFCALALLLALLLLFVPVAYRRASTEHETPDVTDKDSAATTTDPAAAVTTTGGTADPGKVTARYERDFVSPVPQKDYIPANNAASVLLSSSEIDATNAILVNATDGTVIASRLADERIYPASMTKVMTLIVACERLEQAELEEKVIVTREIVDEAYRAGASRAGFEAGEAVRILDLLYGIALPSGADATAALASYLAGGEARFVLWMNEKAEQLGLVGTHFVNTSGLHDKDHYSTAREIAAMMAYAMEMPLCRALLGAKTYTTAPTDAHPEGITLYSTTFSRMTTTQFGMVSVLAGKTGYTNEARFCLVTYAERPDGTGYVLVTAGGTTKYTPVTDSAALYRKYIK